MDLNDITLNVHWLILYAMYLLTNDVTWELTRRQDKATQYNRKTMQHNTPEAVINLRHACPARVGRVCVSVVTSLNHQF